MAARTGTITSPVIAGSARGDVNRIVCAFAGAAATGDVITFGDLVQQFLPQYSILLTAVLTVQDPGNAAAVTGQVGYASIDGSTGNSFAPALFPAGTVTANGTVQPNGTVSQPDADPAYFVASGTTLTPPLRQAKNTTKFNVVLAKGSNPTLTIQSGALSAQAMLTLEVDYKYNGTP